MTIQTGDALPDATLTETTEFGEACPIGPQKLSVAEQARGKKIVVFGLPGAYTPTCSAKHLPGYVAQLDALKARGVDEVWCVAVNDGFVMAAWGKEHGAIGKVRMLGDGSAELTRKLGLDTEIPGMGVRSRRYSLLVDDGVVQRVNVEEAGKFAVSNVETMLEQLG
jgi:glutaredoxin/glutathione-dependent peroxiredoxin